jgi:hypothetical protein
LISDASNHHHSDEGQCHCIHQADQSSGCKQCNVPQGAYCCGSGGFDVSEIYGGQTKGVVVGGVECGSHDFLLVGIWFR